jgi:hypothetical protein
MDGALGPDRGVRILRFGISGIRANAMRRLADASGMAGMLQDQWGTTTNNKTWSY